MDNDKNSTNWKYIMGAGLGLAVGLYANSKKGREHRKIAAGYVEDTVAAAQEKGQEVLTKSNDLVVDLKNKGINYLSNLQSNNDKAADDISQYIEKEMEALEKKVNNKIAAVKKEMA